VSTAEHSVLYGGAEIAGVDNAGLDETAIRLGIAVLDTGGQ